MIITLAQMLVEETSFLTKRVEVLKGVHSSFQLRQSLTFSQKVLDMMKFSKAEITKAITDSVVQSIVSRVVTQNEQRNEIVETVVSDMIDVFLDSKEENKESSLRDKLIVEGIVSEIVEGIVEVVAKPPSEPLLLFREKEVDAVSDAVDVCELAVLAMNLVIMVLVTDGCDR